MSRSPSRSRSSRSAGGRDLSSATSTSTGPTGSSSLPARKSSSLGGEHLTSTLDPAAAVFAFVEYRMLVSPAPEVRVPLASELKDFWAQDHGNPVAGPFPVGRPGERAAVAVAMSPAA